MNVTDEMVERAAEAAYMADIFRLRTESDIGLTWETLAKAAPTTAAERYRRMARAALEAALGDVEQEPLTEISARCEECGGQWFWPLDDRQELILTTCHEHSDPPEPLEDVLLALQPGDYDPMKGEA